MKRLLTLITILAVISLPLSAVAAGRVFYGSGGHSSTSFGIGVNSNGGARIGFSHSSSSRVRHSSTTVVRGGGYYGRPYYGGSRTVVINNGGYYPRHRVVHKPVIINNYYDSGYRPYVHSTGHAAWEMHSNSALRRERYVSERAYSWGQEW